MAKKKSSKIELTNDSWVIVSDNLCPRPDSVLQKYADALLDWAQNNDDAIRTKDFMYLQRVSPEVFYNWADRYPPLKAALAMANDMVGGRRERNGLMRKFDPGLVERTMPMYNKEYKEWKMAQNKVMAEQMNSAPRIVVLEKFPEKKEEVKTNE